MNRLPRLFITKIVLNICFRWLCKRWWWLRLCIDAVLRRRSSGHNHCCFLCRSLPFLLLIMFLSSMHFVWSFVHSFLLAVCSFSLSLPLSMYLILQHNRTPIWWVTLTLNFYVKLIPGIRHAYPELNFGVHEWLAASLSVCMCAQGKGS